jgi:hypothetical protein
MSVQLQFVRGADLGAKLIEWFSHNGDWSHVDVVWPDGRLFGARSDQVGGARPGVQFRDPSYIGTNRTQRVSIPLMAAEEKKFYDWLLAQEGKPYDIEGILSFVSGRDWQEPDSWFCSEMACAALVECSYFPHPLAAPSNKITPPDLLLLISVQTPVELSA